MRNEWKSDEFSAATIAENMKSKVFDVPKYQRGIVWTDEQRLGLVDTIKKGLPFGSLLLYEKADGGYQIIDGLQRCTSLIKFVTNPTLFFDEDDIDYNAIHTIAAEVGAVGNQTAIEDRIKENLLRWVKEEHTTMSAVESMQFSKFGKLLSSEFPTLIGKEFDIGDLIQPMMDEYKAICKKISETRVPAIVVTGDPDMLPILFERINSQGTKLTKYQIYAATWIDDKFIIDDPDLFDIIAANRDRYDQMLDNAGSLGDYDPVEFVNNKELNSFEVAYGFGKMLSSKWPHLFTPSSEKYGVESAGFNLINICAGMKNKDVKVMNITLRDRVGDNICLFLKKIIEAVKFVDERIGKYCKFKLNSRIKEGRPLHSEFQIISAIASVFLCKHAIIKYDSNSNIIDISFVLNQTNAAWRNAQKTEFKKNFPKIYIMDALQRKWSGTGDRKMDQALIVPSYYCHNVKKNDFEEVMDSWYKQLNNERLEIGKVTSPKEPEQILLAVLYLTSFSANQQLDDSKYDIEHLATKKLMKKHLDNYNGELRLPISSFGNLCLLPQYENRSKGEKTIYDDENYLVKSGMTIEDVEKRYSFTTRDSLIWINDFTLTMEEVQEHYFDFINNRYKTMKSIILDHYEKI